MAQIIGSIYEIIGKLGEGGGGRVYLANHLNLKKRVVIKADKRDATLREDLLRREVDVLKELRHTYIPQVYDYFIENDISYTVMDYVDGDSLDVVLDREKRFSQPNVIHWACQLLEALSYLHSPTHGNPPRGYVHSDIKPANIMLRPNGDICLIDFNISLAIGIETAVGRSEGYSSPEHYGYDYSSGNKNTANEKTELIEEKTELLSDTLNSQFYNDKTELVSYVADNERFSYSSYKRIIIPDARSDIYSLGATLYHLLCGRRPAKDAKAVIPLSKKDFSPPLVDIITKAMNPNPDLRYQTADEMLEAFKRLWRDDPRVKRQKRRAIIASTIFGAMLIVGGLMTFVGLRQMERIQAAHVLANDSASALSRGDVDGALDYALEALVDDPGMFDIPYTADAQLALTNALGVYDLSDSFKPYETIELPSAPFKICVTPDKTRLIASYAYEIAIYDIESGSLLETLSTVDSAMCDVEFLSDDVIVYAAEDGVTAYDLSSHSVLWKGEQGTTISVSKDKRIVAAIYRRDSIVNFYDAADGTLISIRDLEGKHLNLPENDRFADTKRDVFALNADGSYLAISLSDGSLTLLDPYNKYNDLIIYEESSYAAFDGDFAGSYFAFSATDSTGSKFGLVDTSSDKLVCEMRGNSKYNVEIINGEIYLSQNDTIVKFEPDDFTQTAIVYTENINITDFGISESYMIAATDDNGYSIFYRGAGLLQTEMRVNKADFVEITNEYAIIADRNSTTIEVLKLKDYGDVCVLEYDPRITHSEARLMSDHTSVMLFSINDFTICDADGNVTASGDFPSPGSIYDQQYRRENGSEFLEVTYYDGKVVCYSAVEGKIVSEKTIEPPDEGLYEEFYTDTLVIKSPLHGTPCAYDIKTEKLVAELNSDDYLTYITQFDEYIIAQYVTTDGSKYGVLMNNKCETLAQLPYLNDIVNGTLVFDYPAGNIKISPIYELSELKEMAKTRRN